MRPMPANDGRSSGRSAISTRLRYLNNAAHLLALTAPQASAQMMSQQVQLAVDNDVQLSQSRERDFCTACGNVFVPGWTVEVGIQSVRACKGRKRKGQKEGVRRVTALPATSQPAVAILSRREIQSACKLCSRTTRYSLRNEKPHPVTTVPSTTAGDLDDVLSASASKATPPQSTTGTPGNRKRVRSKKLGLHAMVAQSQSGDASIGPNATFGLDLMDFMKQDRG